MATVDLSQDRPMVNMSGDTKATPASGGGYAAGGAPRPSNQSTAPSSGISTGSGPGSVLQTVAETAQATVTRGLAEAKSFMEQNPSQVRAMVFLLACISAVYCALGFLNIFSTLTSPIQYLVNIYCFVFAVITIILEGKTEWPGVSRFQEKVFYQAHFLSTIQGRAMFYVFQGTFGMARLDEDMLMFLFGVGFFGIGTLILMQSWKSGRTEAHQQLRESFVPQGP